MPHLAQVILPLPIYSAFTYRVPDDMMTTLRIGTRVLVPFGRRSFQTGIVESFPSVAPSGYELKEIAAVLDEEPIVKFPQLKFWNWIADYYLCTPGEVMKAALPAGLKVESETVVSLPAAADDDTPETPAALSEDEAMILQFVDHNGKAKISELDSIENVGSARKAVKSLLESGRLEIHERIVDKYVSRKITTVSLNCGHDDNERLHQFFDLVNRAHKQEKLLVAFLEMSGWMNRRSENLPVERKQLLQRALSTPAVLKAMVDKGIFTLGKKTINRFTTDDPGKEFKPQLPALSPLQGETLKSIDTQWKDHQVVLLRGVTGSGKTEIYAHIINQCLDAGLQALFLVPEISLTTQLTTRLRRIFGNRLLVYHSKFSDNERVDIWRRLLQSHEPMVVLGVRSSVFLPFGKLGVVIVDEEHESSYKQQEPAPRYNARDAAIVLAAMHGAKTLLGSATPTVETYYKALHGKYGLVELLQRYEEAQLPDVEIIDMRIQRKKHNVTGGLYSDAMMASLRKSLGEGRQAIVFQNRRGFAPVVVCSQCGWTPKCPDCDVSPIYHRRTDELRCHYCGRSQRLPKVCPACGQNSVEIYGFGTERIADDLHAMLPGYKVGRMDFDTTRAKDSYEEIINEFSANDTQLLVGTQMVSKGLDFDNVDVVAIPNADTILNFPDFRSDERAFNMLEQVAGRAGRRARKGKVIIQTTSPQNEVLAFLKTHDYSEFYKWEIENRRTFMYPPFTKVIRIFLRNKNNDTVSRLAAEYTRRLTDIFGRRVMGLETPQVSRISTFHIRTVMLKIEAGASMSKVKNILREVYVGLADLPGMKSTLIHFDVDPV